MALTKITSNMIAAGAIDSTHIGGINTADVSETTNLYFTDARADARIAAANTGNLTEGSNLYFTNARADARIVNAGSVNWNTAYGWGDHGTQSYATQTYVVTQITNLVDSSPTTLDTLNELAAALGDDPNFATTVTNSIAAKLPLAGGTLTGTLVVPAVTVGNSSIGSNSSHLANITINNNGYIGTTYDSTSLNFTTAGDLVATGKLGIGTPVNTAPSVRLEVGDGVSSETIKVNAGTGWADLRLHSASTNGGSIYFNDGADAGQLFYYHADDSMRFHTATTERMRIDASGKVGIAEGGVIYASRFSAGKPANHVPGAALTSSPHAFYSEAELGGTTGNDQKIAVFAGSDATNVSGLALYRYRRSTGTNWTTDGFSLRQEVDGTANIFNYMNFAGGNVGIGTDTPTAKLTVAGDLTIGTGTQAVNGDGTLTIRKGDAFAGLDFQSARTAGNIGGTRFYNTSSTSVPAAQFLIEVDGSYNFYNGTNGAQNRLKIDASGNVGIGRTNPTAPLEVFSGEIATGANKGIRLVNNSASKMYSIRTGIVGAENTSFAIHDDTASTNRLVISSAGNVGIGTSPDGANGRLQVAGGISTTGNSEIRQSTNSDGSTLKIIATNVVVGHTNAIGYSYSGGGLLAAVSTSGSTTVLDAGAYDTSNGHRLKIINDGSGISGSLEYLAGATPLLKVVSSSGTVLVGHSSGNTGARFEVRGNQTSHLNAMTSGNASIVGSGIPGQIAEGVLALPAGSLGTQVTIPVYSQSNLWRQYVVEIWVSTAEYNYSTNRGGTWKGQFGSLTSINGLATLEGPTGNISSVTASGSNLLVNFTAGYIAGLANYEGVYLYYKVLGGAPSYFQAWNATLN